MHRKFLLGGFALAAAFGAGVAFSPKFVSAEANLISAKEVVREEMTGMPGEEVVVQYVELKPGAPIPWHMHPDGQRSR